MKPVLIACALAIWVLVSLSLQGCTASSSAQMRRLGAQWNALNVTKSTEDLGRTPDSWTAGAFLGTSTLESVANAGDGTQIDYVGQDKLLQGTKITLKKFHFESSPGEMLVTIDAELTDAPLLGTLNVVIHGDLRFAGEIPLNAKSNAVVLRVEPTDIEDKGPGVFSLFLSRRHTYLTHLLADIALENVAESALLIKIPLPSLLQASAGIDTTLQNVQIVSAAASIKLSAPVSTVSEPLPSAALLVRKSGVWLVSGKAPAIHSAYDGPQKAPDQTLQDVLLYLQETHSPLATLPLPPSKGELEAIIETLKKELESSYADDPITAARATPGAGAPTAGVYGFVSGRVIENVLGEFEASPSANRTLTIVSTATGGHLKEAAVLKDGTLGDYQFYVEFVGADAIRGAVTVNLQDTHWTSSGLSGTLTYDATASAHTRLQIELGALQKVPLLGKMARDALGKDITVQGSLPHPIPIPFTLSADFIRGSGASAVVLAPRVGCQIIDLKLMTGADLGITLHHPTIHDQFRPIRVIESQEYFVPIPTAPPKEGASWTITPGYRALQLAVVPQSSVTTDDGLLIGADIAVTPMSLAPHSPEESALIDGINSRNTAAAGALAQAAQQDQAPYTCGLTSSFAVDLGPAQIETKAFLNSIQDVLAEASKIIAGGKDVVEDAAKEAALVGKFAAAVGGKVADTPAKDVGKAVQVTVDAAKQAEKAPGAIAGGVEHVGHEVACHAIPFHKC